MYLLYQSYSVHIIFLLKTKLILLNTLYGFVLRLALLYVTYSVVYFVFFGVLGSAFKVYALEKELYNKLWMKNFVLMIAFSSAVFQVRVLLASFVLERY